MMEHPENVCLVALLVAYGADIHARDNHEQTALDLILQRIKSNVLPNQDDSLVHCADYLSRLETDLQNRPERLLELCRKRIRTCLGPLAKEFQGDCLGKIEKLPLMATLKHYLDYSDITLLYD